jgi:hypothetical protein
MISCVFTLGNIADRQSPQDFYRCFRSLAIFAGQAGSLLFEALRDNVQESRKRPTTWLSRRDHPR